MVTIIIDGDKYEERVKKDFKGDELTSAEQQAILFLKEEDKKSEVF